MANVLALHAISQALVTSLRDSYPAQIAGRPLPPCAFELLSSDGMSSHPLEGQTRVGLYLHQLTIRDDLRQASPAGLAACGSVPLGLELHYLLSAWGATPQNEQIPLAWAIHQLHACPILDVSSLFPEAGWQPDEVLHVSAEPMSLQEQMHLWQSIDQTHRPCMTYVVRGLRLGIDA